MDDDGFSLKQARVCIVGLGLMGGSMALALRQHVGCLTAQDIDATVIRNALASGVIDASGDIADADIIVLATPSDHIIRLIPTLKPSPGAMVIDLGSTKRRICDQLDLLPENVMAVGGHPMCGLAENGYANAVSTLYRNARFVLCRTARTTDTACGLAEALVSACGAHPLWLDRERHDYLTALTSHLPHLLNFGLMRLAMEVAEEDEALFLLASGGFDGATRLARTNQMMVSGIFGTNAENIRSLTTRLREHLDHLEAILESNPELEQELDEIVAARRRYTAEYGERPIA
ncbi:MAG: prephenate dehydrogenase [Anaerolineae bacterium]|nr:prephenate dehydrogenase [Anaerolineae bacterium]